MILQHPVPSEQRRTPWFVRTPIGLLAVSLVALAIGLQPPAASAAGPLSWSAPVPIDQPQVPLTAVSCPSASLCVAVDVEGDVLTSTNPTGGASAWTTTPVDASHFLNAIACPTTSLCVAVDGHGNVVTSTDPTGGASAWTVASVSSALNKVSCPTSTFCAASTGGGEVVTSTNPTGGASAWQSTVIDSGHELASIACASASMCVAVDRQGDLVTSINPTGGAAAWSTPVEIAALANDTPESLNAVACPTTTFCAAVDGYDYNEFDGLSTGDVVTSTNPTGGAAAWSTPAHIANGLFGVTCPSSSFCATTDLSGDVFAATNPQGGASAWSSNKIDSVDGLFTDLAGIACPTASLCVAVDSQGNVVTGTPAAEEPPTGSTQLSWAAPTTIDPGQTLTAIFCPSAPPEALCVAVDNAGNVLTSTNPAGGASAWQKTNIDGTTPLTAVSCEYEGCVAVDGLGNLLIGPGPSTGGTGTWKKTAIDPGNGGLTGVSCPSRDIAQIQFCLAVDHAGNAVLSGGPGEWNNTLIDAPSGHLTGLSCTEFSEWCITWDNLGNVLTSGDPYEGAGAWTVAALDPGTGITGGVCPAQNVMTLNYCLAVDQAGNVMATTEPTGGASAWSVSHVDAHGLTGVSCPYLEPGRFCAAVDDTGNAVTSSNPLGGVAAWSVTPIDLGTSLTGISCPYDGGGTLCVAIDATGQVIVGTGAGAASPPEETSQPESKTSQPPPGSTPTNPTPASTTAGSGATTISSVQLKALLARQLTPSGKTATIAALLKHGGLSLSFTAPEAGRLVVQWYDLPSGAKLAKATKAKPVLIAAGKLTFAAAGTGRVKLTLTAQGRKLLKHVRRVKLEAKAGFTPRGGAMVSSIGGLWMASAGLGR